MSGTLAEFPSWEGSGVSRFMGRLPRNENSRVETPEPRENIEHPTRTSNGSANPRSLRRSVFDVGCSMLDVPPGSWAGGSTHSFPEFSRPLVWNCFMGTHVRFFGALPPRETDLGRDIARRCPHPRISGRHRCAAERGADGAARRPHQVQGFNARNFSGKSLPERKRGVFPH